MLEPHALPRMFPVVQKFPRPRAGDPAAAVTAELTRLFPAGCPAIRPGARIAVTAGSRGIAGIPALTRAAVDFLRSRKARPFIVPAMGSHGGATAEGQRSLLGHLGITEEAMGCPIRAEMETRSLGVGADGVEAFVAEAAWQSDGVLLLNRVKPHTDFKGPLESGLAKICAIGLGKLAGAREYHGRIFDIGLGRAIRSAASAVLATGKVIGGLAVVENAYHETAIVRGVPAARLFEVEAELLDQARALMGSLPFDEIDLLIVDRIGKDISGTGLDTNIIGRCVYGFVPGVPWMEGLPAIRRILVRGVSPGSDGNAVGMGLADFTTPRFAVQVDHAVTQLNAFTARAPIEARLPIVLPTDREAIIAALGTCPRRPEGPRVAHIRDTLSLGALRLSEALLAAARESPRLEVTGPPEPMPFDAEGWLPPIERLSLE